MHQFFYSSLSTHPRGHLSDIDVLSQAIRFNSAQDITGFLLRSTTHFFQILEGEQHTVTKLLTRIENDTRHFGMVTAAPRERDTRAFPDWTVAYAEIEHAKAAQFRERLLKNPANWDDVMGIFKFAKALD